MLEVNIVMTAVIALYAMIVHISLIRLKIKVLQILKVIKQNEGVIPSETFDRIVKEIAKEG